MAIKNKLNILMKYFKELNVWSLADLLSREFVILKKKDGRKARKSHLKIISDIYSNILKTGSFEFLEKISAKKLVYNQTNTHI